MGSQKKYTVAFKINFVKAYKSSGSKTVAKFLKSNPKLYKDIRDNTAFTWVKKFDKGELKEVPNGENCFRLREREFAEVERRLVDWIHTRHKRVVHDSCGLSWNLLLEKARAIAKQIEGCDKFDGTNGPVDSERLRE